MDKIPQKVTKDPNNQDAARKGREKYMNELKESIITDVKKVVQIIVVRAMMLQMITTAPPPPLPLLLINLVLLISQVR